MALIKCAVRFLGLLSRSREGGSASNLVLRYRKSESLGFVCSFLGTGIVRDFKGAGGALVWRLAGVALGWAFAGVVGWPFAGVALGWPFAGVARVARVADGSFRSCAEGEPPSEYSERASGPSMTKEVVISIEDKVFVVVVLC